MRLLCKLFGHKWLVYAMFIDEDNTVIGRCERCGIPKYDYGEGGT